MNVVFEELTAVLRAGGIDSATQGLVAGLTRQGVTVVRRPPGQRDSPDDLPDCVHIHGIWSPALVFRIRYWKRQGVPCVVTVHGMLEPWALANKRMKKWVAWRVYQRHLLNLADVLHATSRREAENLRRLRLKPRVEYIPWGMHLPEIGDALQSEEVPASEAPAVPSTRVAMFVGRIHPVKALPMLVEAWAKTRPVGWRMKIVGPDEAGHREEVEALVREAGLEQDFEFTGHLEGAELRLAYQTADCLILPSHTENFGMVVAEALAHGCPVIASQGTPWRLLEDEGCGWWVPVSVEGIAAALGDLASLSSAELSAMGERGRAVVIEHFDWDRIARQFIACYRSLLEPGRRPGA